MPCFRTIQNLSRNFNTDPGIQYDALDHMALRCDTTSKFPQELKGCCAISYDSMLFNNGIHVDRLTGNPIQT